MRALVLTASVAVVVAGAAWPDAGNMAAPAGTKAAWEPATAGTEAASEPAPPGTPRPWGRPVWVQVDTDLAIEACDGLAPVIGTRPVPLVGCRPWQSCRVCEPGRAEAGQVFVLWPSTWRYRVYRPDGTPTGEATAAPSATPAAPCAPRFVVVVVTATPSATARPTETMELTPTAVPTRATWWPIVLQRRAPQ